MRAAAALLALLGLAACATSPATDVAERRAQPDLALPPMKVFSEPTVVRPTRSNAALARDILDLTFELESGRPLPVLTRFEGPITIRVTGRSPTFLDRDLNRLISRIRREARIDVSRVPASQPAGITIEVVTRAELSRAVPQAACFVVPRVASWDEFRRSRRSAKLDWTTLTTRETMAIFIPGDVAPQEVRDCLHEEVAQAIGPLNDLYRLPDSVFNDDNFHTVLTGFDTLVLRVLYDDALSSGMTRAQVAERLPGILARVNPRGVRGGDGPVPETGRDWINAIEAALGPRTPPERRRGAATAAVQIAQSEGWTDNRLAFSLYAYGRLSIGTDPERALAAFLQSAALFQAEETTQLQAAHVAMQLAAFALSAGQGDVALEIVNDNLRAVAEAENAALLATLLMVKAEALDLVGRSAEAREVRRDSLGWARYGFGAEAEVRARAAEIAGLTPTLVIVSAR
ncbi:MAG: DUF2927 domain-containing protein [Pseudomonadota bacterium]